MSGVFKLVDHDGTSRVTNISPEWWVYGNVAHKVNIYERMNDSLYGKDEFTVYEMTACGKIVKMEWRIAKTAKKCEDCKLVDTMWELAE